MWRGSPLERRLAAQIDRWAQEGLRRTLRPPTGIDLSSNDYLNLSRHPAVVDAFRAAALRDGVGSTGSRLLRGHREAFDSVEKRFAEFKGAEQSVYFSSGYLANIAVLTTLSESGDVVFSDALNHASLIDGIRLSKAARVVFPHRDAAALADAMRSTPCQGIRFVVLESIFSMDGDIAPLAAIGGICRDMNAVLVVDEAHAVGIFGPSGEGLVDSTLTDRVTCVTINTASKALGVSGAFVAGPSSLVEFLVQRARPFVFSTAPPPAVAAAIDTSLGIVQSEPELRSRVLANAAHFRRRLHEIGVSAPESPSQIVPVHIGDNGGASAIASRLQDQGFDVRAIRPPSVPAGTARLRVSINAGLTTRIIDAFADALALALQETGVCSAASL